MPASTLWLRAGSVRPASPQSPIEIKVLSSHDLHERTSAALLLQRAVRSLLARSHAHMYEEGAPLCSAADGEANEPAGVVCVDNVPPVPTPIPRQGVSVCGGPGSSFPDIPDLAPPPMAAEMPAHSAARSFLQGGTGIWGQRHQPTVHSSSPLLGDSARSRPRSPSQSASQSPPPRSPARARRVTGRAVPGMAANMCAPNSMMWSKQLGNGGGSAAFERMHPPLDQESQQASTQHQMASSLCSSAHNGSGAHASRTHRNAICTDGSDGGSTAAWQRLPGSKRTVPLHTGHGIVPYSRPGSARGAVQHEPSPPSSYTLPSPRASKLAHFREGLVAPHTEPIYDSIIGRVGLSASHATARKRPASAAATCTGARSAGRGWPPMPLSASSASTGGSSPISRPRSARSHACAVACATAAAGQSIRNGRPRSPTTAAAVGVWAARSENRRSIQAAIEAESFGPWSGESYHSDLPSRPPSARHPTSNLEDDSCHSSIGPHALLSPAAADLRALDDPTSLPTTPRTADPAWTRMHDRATRHQKYGDVRVSATHLKVLVPFAARASSTTTSTRRSPRSFHASPATHASGLGTLAGNGYTVAHAAAQLVSRPAAVTHAVLDHAGRLSQVSPVMALQHRWGAASTSGDSRVQQHVVPAWAVSKAPSRMPYDRRSPIAKTVALTFESVSKGLSVARSVASTS